MNILEMVPSSIFRTILSQASPRREDTHQLSIAGDVSPAARSAVKVGGSDVGGVAAFCPVTFRLVEMLHVQIRFRTLIRC